MRYLGPVEESTESTESLGRRGGIFIPPENSKIEKAKIIASTFGVPFSVAYDTEDVLSKEFEAADSKWVATAKNSFKRGIGNTYTTFGRALEMIGLKDFGSIYTAYGQGLQYKYAPPVKPEEFTFDKVLDPDWWATTPFESLPFTLSLIPAALIAGYGGVAAATAIGLGVFGKVVLGSIGAGLVSRTIESALEAGGTYDESLAHGEADEMARQRADFTFKRNMIPLTGSDIAQFLLAFTPLSKMGGTGLLAKRIAAIAFKVAGVGAMEAVEEMWQEAVQQVARGERPSITPEMKEAMVVGGIFGVGLGGTGSVWTAMTERIKSTASDEIMKVYEETKAAEIALGATEQEAEIKALDAVAETPEGKKHIETVMNEIKNMAEGVEIDETAKTKEAEQTLEKIPELDILTDQDIESIAKNEIDTMDILDTTLPTFEELLVESEQKATERERIHKKFLVKQETYESAKERLHEKLSGLKAGIDPTALADMAIVGAYHIERGVRKFADWSKLMIEKYGEKIKPHLREIWKASNAYLKSKVPTKEVKGLVRETTGQVSLADFIREDVALSAAMKKAEQNARIAYREGKKDALAKAKLEFKEILLKAKIKSEVMAFKEGFRVGGRLTAAHLIEGFKDAKLTANETRAMLVEYINDNLPPDLRGRFLNPIIQNMTKKKQASIWKRVDEIRENFERKKLVKEISELKELKGDIALDYQQKLNDLLEDIDTKKITTKTFMKLQGLKNYIEKHGVPSGIKTETLDRLKRLEMRGVEEMTTDELKFLVDTATHLRELGILKQQLKYKYNERMRQRARDKLLLSTYNLDPNLTGKDTHLDKIKKGSMFLYLDTLQALRVADMIDGYQAYAGENSKLIKRTMAKETEAITKIKALMDSAIHEMIDVGIKELTDEQNVKIMINIRNLEGAYDQVKTLMDKYGYKSIPTLTAQESKVIEIIEKYINQDVDRIAAIYEEIENKEFHKLPRYILPIKYEKEFNIIPSEAVEQSRYRTTQTYQGFTIERQRGVKKIPRVDVLGIFENALNDQQWYINMQPELENIRYLVRSKEFSEKAGELASDWWRDRLDMIARRGGSATASHTPFTNLLREFRFNLAKAILGYKVSSIIMQPFAVFDAMAYAQANWGTSASLEIIKEFTKAWAIPKYAKDYIATSPMLQHRMAGEVAVEELLRKIGRSEGKVDKFIKGSMSLLMKADVRTAAGVESALENILTKYGIPNAKQEAEILMNILSSSSEVTFRPNILSRGEGARTWFTFQTFFLNRWGIIAHDLISAGVIHGNWKAKYSALLGIAIFMAGGIAEDEARRYMFEMITRRKIPDRSTILQDIIFYIPSMIPYFGNIIDVAKGSIGGDIPIQRVFENLFQAKNLITGKTAEAKLRGLMKTLEALATLRGIPGTSQFFDLMEGIFLAEDKKKKEPKLVKPKIGARP